MNQHCYQHSSTAIWCALDPLMGRRKRPCPLRVQSTVNRVLAVIANRKRITKEISVRFDRRPSSTVRIGGPLHS